MKKLNCFVAFSAVFMLCLASEAGAATPWLEGVTIGPVPTEPTPSLSMQIYCEDGKPVPATLTEDLPILLTAESAIFDDYPPESSDTPNASWVNKTSFEWYVTDWDDKKNTPAYSNNNVAPNQCWVTPVKPSDNGGINCFATRKMRYDGLDGEEKFTFANAGKGNVCRILDITPPCCGIEITTKSGKSGSCWPAENPPNEYPLPKHADVYVAGELFNASDEGELGAEGIELGDGMVLNSRAVALRLSRHDIITVKIIGDDNYKLNPAKVYFGISAGPNTPSVCPENTGETLNLSELRIPRRPYFFVTAEDMAGNKQELYIPIKLQRR